MIIQNSYPSKIYCSQPDITKKLFKVNHLIYAKPESSINSQLDIDLLDPLVLNVDIDLLVSNILVIYLTDRLLHIQVATLENFKFSTD